MEKVLGALDSRCQILNLDEDNLHIARNKALTRIFFVRLDKKRFLERNESAFMIPKKFEYLPIR